MKSNPGGWTLKGIFWSLSLTVRSSEVPDHFQAPLSRKWPLILVRLWEPWGIREGGMSAPESREHGQISTLTWSPIPHLETLKNHFLGLLRDVKGGNHGCHPPHQPLGSEGRTQQLSLEWMNEWFLLTCATFLKHSAPSLCLLIKPPQEGFCGDLRF